MKKIISLLATIAMMATMVTSVSAAAIANNAPVVDTTVVELTAAEFENDWVGEALPAGEKAYLVDINVSGLDLEMACAGKTNVLKKKRSGIGLMYAGYAINFDSTDNIGAVYTMDGIAAGSTVEKTVNSVFLATKATEAYPTVADGGAAATATEAFIYQFVITTKGEVTGTPVAQFKVTQLDQDSSVDTKDIIGDLITYTVNGEAATTVTFGKEEGGEIDPPAETEVVTSEKIDLVAEDGVKGAAWDVTIKNFDSAKAYMATFTNLDTDEVRRGQADEIDVSKFAETTGDVSFAVIMKLLTVTNVGLDIAIQ